MGEVEVPRVESGFSEKTETDAGSDSSSFRLPAKDRFVVSFGSTVAWIVLWFLGQTWRIRVIGGEHHEKLVATGRPFIFSVWHDNILAALFWHRGRRIRPMVSHHRDGEMIAKLLTLFGYDPIRGSSTRGGNAAFREMVKELQAGKCGAIMPDGPRGPRHDYKPGTILIASRAGASLLPLTFDAEQKKVFRSWDRMKLPLPFARVLLRYGPPIDVPGMIEGATLETFRLSVQDTMNRLDDAASADLRAWVDSAP